VRVERTELVFGAKALLDLSHTVFRGNRATFVGLWIKKNLSLPPVNRYLSATCVDGVTQQ